MVTFVKDRPKLTKNSKHKTIRGYLKTKKAKRSPKRTSKPKGPEILADSVIEGMQEKKGQEIVTIDNGNGKIHMLEFHINHGNSHAFSDFRRKYERRSIGVWL